MRLGSLFLHHAEAAWLIIHGCCKGIVCRKRMKITTEQFSLWKRASLLIWNFSPPPPPLCDLAEQEMSMPNQTAERPGSQKEVAAGQTGFKPNPSPPLHFTGKSTRFLKGAGFSWRWDTEQQQKIVTVLNEIKIRAKSRQEFSAPNTSLPTPKCR